MNTVTDKNDINVDIVNTYKAILLSQEVSRVRFSIDCKKDNTLFSNLSKHLDILYDFLEDKYCNYLSNIIITKDKNNITKNIKSFINHYRTSILINIVSYIGIYFCNLSSNVRLLDV